MKVSSGAGGWGRSGGKGIQSAVVKGDWTLGGQRAMPRTGDAAWDPRD